MRISILAVLALVAVAAVSVAAQSSTGGAGPLNSACARVTAYMKLDPTSPADQYTAMQAFIVKVATSGTGGLFNNPITKRYFDGTVTYRNGTVTASPFGMGAGSWAGPVTPDYTRDATALNVLVPHLAQFFGTPFACLVSASAGAPFPQYMSSYGGFGVFNQYQVHANMQIGEAVFTAFNNQAGLIAKQMGANDADLTGISQALASFGRNNVNGSPSASEICTQADCDCIPGVTGDNCDNNNSVAYTSASFVTMAAAALVALFAMRR